MKKLFKLARPGRDRRGRLGPLPDVKRYLEMRRM